MKQVFLTLGLVLGGIMSLDAQQKSFGTWKSPIVSELLTKDTIKFTELSVDGDDLYHCEGRPSDGGRTVYMRSSDGTELYPSPFYTRSTIHEYGGRAGMVIEGVLYFSNFSDQFLYKVEVGKEPEIVADLENMRYIDLQMHPNKKWIFAMGEDHTHFPKIENLLVKVDIETGKVDRIATGHDFFAGPQISPDGKQLAYYLWDFPRMPWDGTELWVADIDDDGMLTNNKFVCGGPNESVISPSWSPDGKLYYASDRNGFWNLYEETGRCVYEMDAEFASPPWWTGYLNYHFVEVDGRPHIVTCVCEKAVESIALIDLERPSLKKLDIDVNFVSSILPYKDGIVYIGAGAEQGSRIGTYDFKTKQHKIIKKAGKSHVDPSFISKGQSIEFPTSDDKTAFAFYYPPTNPNFKGLDGETPPCVVFSHGGPTGNTNPAVNLGVQYWTSRGFAIVDVNYGGSTGFGKAYKDRLVEKWGEVDVDDCCNAALYLVDKGLADPKRLAIRGGSAGGYTTLACLAFKDVFQVGANYFGVSDLHAMVEHTHKFESRYFDILVSPSLDSPRYTQFAPACRANEISCPVIILQGDEDKIVPPEQSQIIYDALMEREIPTAYLLFKGEQHGFRKSENIKRSIDAEYYFYCKILKMELPEDIDPVEIQNL